jgi:nucleotide-binding universal stress UspA family protein
VFQEVDNIVVGAEDSPTSRQAVAAAARFARLVNGNLHIVTANNAYKGPSRSSVGGYVEDPHPEDEVLNELAKVAEDEGLKPIMHFSTDAPADAVVTIAEELNADLIVVGNQGMKGVRRVLGSIPNTVAHNAHCSVLIVDTMEDS